MDANLVKGHFFLAQALLEMDNYDEAIKHLQRGKKSSFKPQVKYFMYNSKVICMPCVV
jgi:predicted Zn-dependent protease